MTLGSMLVYPTKQSQRSYFAHYCIPSAKPGPLTQNTMLSPVWITGELLHKVSTETSQISSLVIYFFLLRARQTERPSKNRMRRDFNYSVFSVF